MNAQSFLDELKRHLHKLSPSERDDVLYDFREHIQMAMESGKDELEAVQGLGDPKTIAKEILADKFIEAASAKPNVSNIMRAIFAAVSLGFFNLVIVIGPVCGCIGVLAGMFAASVSLVVSPLIGLAMIWENYPSPTTIIFAMCFTEGIGMLLSIAFIMLAKVFGRAMIRYLRLNVRIVKGGQAT
ncbi:HAAS signaling domain-containing protein [Alicyclobacillus fodiniaquatilis]|jgi:uncharacterized membrane protein|uniref:DUF1700 domain-containing protein n=1 Tax=Alicyclobacillus fodiniaquatilis TaxID=1661150 RepID=A0ABW4JIW3_9BACL